MVLMFDGIHSLMFLPLNLKMMFPSSPEQVYFGVKGRGGHKRGKPIHKSDSLPGHHDIPQNWKYPSE